MKHSNIALKTIHGPGREDPPKGGLSLSPREAGKILRSLERRIRQLVPDHRNPHRFHEEKSDIAHELAKISRRIAQ